MQKWMKNILLLSIIVALAGCAGAKKEQGDAGAASGDGDKTFTKDADSSFKGNPLDDPNSPLSRRVVYFDFDSSEIQAEDRDVLAAHANYMAQHPGVSVVLEGHADERGTREYNIALGERRAKAVRQLMLVQGASKKQSQVISFGEERPIALEHNESAWRLNRRVEIFYSGQ